MKNGERDDGVAKRGVDRCLKRPECNQVYERAGY